MQHDVIEAIRDTFDSRRTFPVEWQFLCSIPSLGLLPIAERPEVAFTGRSNVGKSSLINALTNRRNLARTSITPGRTQELNFFLPINGTFYMVDMPGYGYAKAPKSKVKAWTKTSRSYFRERSTLRRVFILIDSRHGLKDIDFFLFNLLDEVAVPYQVVLTKIDKLKTEVTKQCINITENAVSNYTAAFPIVISTSSQWRHGLDELKLSILEAVG
ncbi:MAG: YihA family ribosome biogenesis GTP-binding protein [Hyphomicrobiaceae bacterium]|nr:YihA family ribosome biogenesis GTP-binding protein [Hyphomicrobiaceae bacterium]